MVTALQQWLGDQIVPLFFVGFAILMGFGLLYFSAKGRKAALKRDRSGRTQQTFVDFLAPYGFDPEIAAATYRYLQERQMVAFPILPTDDLDRDLGLDENEVKTTVRDLLSEMNREYLPGLLDSPLVTVVDVVRCIQASPRRVATAQRRSA
jgi:hypothetical protein